MAAFDFSFTQFFPEVAMSGLRTLFLTVDFINDIVHRDGRIPTCHNMVSERGVIARSNQALAWAREQGYLVAHVKVGFPPSYANCPAHSPIFGKAPQAGALDLEGWGTRFHADLAVRDDEPVIVKPRVSAFYNTGLEALLRANRVERLILAGVSTCHAIELSAREAHDRDYRVVVLRDCCASASEAQHERTLQGGLGRVAEILTLEQARAAAGREG